MTYQQNVFKRYHSDKHFRSFTYKMTAKINWHRYGTKLRHCHPMCIQLLLSLFAGRSNHVESREPRLIHR